MRYLKVGLATSSKRLTFQMNIQRQLICFAWQFVFFWKMKSFSRGVGLFVVTSGNMILLPVFRRCHIAFGISRVHLSHCRASEPEKKNYLNAIRPAPPTINAVILHEIACGYCTITKRMSFILRRMVHMTAATRQQNDIPAPSTIRTSSATAQ